MRRWGRQRWRPGTMPMSLAVALASTSALLEGVEKTSATARTVWVQQAKEHTHCSQPWLAVL